MGTEDGNGHWFPADDVEVQRPNVHEPEVIAKSATFRLNTKAAEALAQVAERYGINRTPYGVRAARDPDDPNMICLQPAPAGTPHVIKMKYNKSGDMTINMNKFVHHYHFVLPKGNNLVMTATPVEHPVLGWVLRLNFKAGTERTPKKRAPHHAANG